MLSTLSTAWRTSRSVMRLRQSTSSILTRTALISGENNRRGEVEWIAQVCLEGGITESGGFPWVATSRKIEEDDSK